MSGEGWGRHHADRSKAPSAYVHMCMYVYVYVHVHVHHGERPQSRRRLWPPSLLLAGCSYS